MKSLQKHFQIPKYCIRDISRHHISFWVSTKCFHCLYVNTSTWGCFLTNASTLMSIWQRLYKTLFMVIFFYHVLWRKQKVGYWFLQIHANLYRARAYAVIIVIDNEKEAFVNSFPMHFACLFWCSYISISSMNFYDLNAFIVYLKICMYICKQTPPGIHIDMDDMDDMNVDT